MGTEREGLAITSEAADDSVLVTVGGDLDAATGPDLANMLAEAVDGRWKVVIVDMSAVRFIDSTALRTLVAVKTRADDNGTRLALRSPSEAIMRVLEATALASFIPIVP